MPYLYSLIFENVHEHGSNIVKFVNKHTRYSTNWLLVNNFPRIALST
jgi:hypothetical protein